METAPRSALDTEAPLRVLIIDDDVEESRTLQGLLEAASEIEFEVAHAQRVEQGLQLLRDGDFEAVLLDLGLEESQGIDTLAPARVAAATVAVVAMGTEDDEDLALRAHRYGAQDYLVKAECDSRTLVRTLRHSIERTPHPARTLDRSRRYEHYLATHDSLTGLPNRLALMDNLRRSVATAARTETQVALLFLDLDRFKNINDSIGHGTGDAVLRVVARRLSSLVRTSDMVARLGGDEFVVMLQGVKREQDPRHGGSEDHARHDGTLRRRRPRVPRHHQHRDRRLSPRTAAKPDVLIHNAETAMYARQGEADRTASPTTTRST